MNDSGQLEGRHAIREGYLTDSTGAAIQGDKLYWWEGIRWHGITALWRMDGKRPRELKPLVRK